jgi:CubicO group peptidase (beta-lactamase class C family)
MAAVRTDGAISAQASGLRDSRSRRAVGDLTIFEAASLSKPVFSYAVLQMVDAGVVSLDEPLASHVPDDVLDDPRMARITARHVLTHMTGLPNWRSAEHPFRTYFDPGERFSYSGEGFVYLQHVVERITGEPLDTTMHRLVFEPLGMRDSSYVWQDRFEDDHAVPHDERLEPLPKLRPDHANAAYTLHTTAIDYARFLRAVLAGDRLKAATARLWIEPRVKVPRGRSECLDPVSEDELDPSVAWSLGWGIEPDAGTFFHWGANDGFRAFAIGSPADGSAVAVFTNSDAGLSVVRPILQRCIPGARPSLDWLDSC